MPWTAWMIIVVIITCLKSLVNKSWRKMCLQSSGSRSSNGQLAVAKLNLRFQLPTCASNGQCEFCWQTAESMWMDCGSGGLAIWVALTWGWYLVRQHRAQKGRKPQLVQSHPCTSRKPSFHQSHLLYFVSFLRIKIANAFTHYCTSKVLNIWTTMRW